MRKTGIFSLLAISIALANILLNHYFSTKPQNPNYYLSKEFFSCFVAFVIVPITIILRNPTMSKFTIQWFLTSTLVLIFDQVYHKLRAKYAYRIKNNVIDIIS